MVEPKYPDIFVQMSGENGNTGAIMGRVSDAMKLGGAEAEDIKAFRLAVFDCGSYDDVLALVMRTVTVA